MISKIREAITAFNKRLGNRKKETPEVSLRDNPKAKDQEKSDTDKIDKAILLFKQRRRNGTKGTPDISSGNNSEEISGLSQQDISEGAPAISFLKDSEEIPEISRMNVSKEIPEADLRDNSEEKQAHLGNALQSDTDGAPDISTQNYSDEKEKEKAGWVSPTYCQCRSIQLNPGFIAENRCLAYLDNVPEAEAYRVLRTQVLQRTKVSGSNTIMVTSALPGEGKTLAAINLAFTFAREFLHTVLLVDGDLKKQSVHKYLGCAGEKGLIDYLADGSPLSELITWPGIEKMTLISGGRPFHESAEILGSPRMKELIADMKGRYPDRYIIFDVPPILTGADALTFAPLVDRVIVVVQAGKTSMDDLKKALQFLPKEKILGFVLNRCSSS